MQDRDEIEEEKGTKNIREEMQGRNTTGQAKTTNGGSRNNWARTGQGQQNTSLTINKKYWKARKKQRGKRETRKNYWYHKIYRTLTTAGIQKPAGKNKNWKSKRSKSSW